MELSTTKNRKSNTHQDTLSVLQSQTTHTHTHMRTTPHPQTHFTISSAWRSTCQLLPVAEKDGLCWFCEAHRQDPPGDGRSPAAQTSALFTSPHRQSVFYTASLYQRSMHYRTAIEQEIKLGDRYLAEENEPVWSSLTTYTTRTIKYHTFLDKFLSQHSLVFPPAHSNLPLFFSVFLPFLSSSNSLSSSAHFCSCRAMFVEYMKQNILMDVWTAWDTSAWEPPPCDRELWQGIETTTRGEIVDIFLLFLQCLFFSHGDPPCWTPSSSYSYILIIWKKNFF